MDSIEHRSLGRICTVLFFLASITAISGTPPKEGVLFYHSFDKGLTADYAAGKAEPIKSSGSALTDGHTGKGMVQNDFGSLVFAAEKNINPAAGTVAMWVKPVNWSGREQYFHHFFNFGSLNKNCRYLQLYKYYKSTILFLARNPAVKDNFSLYGSKSFLKWLPGEWHHLAFSWSKAENQCILYCDGIPVKGKYREDLFPDDTAQLSAGLGFNLLSKAEYNNPAHRTVIDELYIFDRPIGDGGVADLMSTGISSVEKAPRFSIPKTSNPPKIDGVISAHEYDSFFSTNTFVEYCRNGFYPRETRLYTAYDDKNLYVTFQSRTKGGDQNIEIIARQLERDSNVWKDDSVEIILRPPGQDIVHIFVNSIGTIYDMKKGDKSFNGNYDISSRIHDIWWVCEIKIPFSELGYSVPKSGDVWKIHFARNWKNPANFVSLSDNSNFYKLETTPDWCFEDDGIFSTSRLDIDAVQSQQIILNGTVFSKTNTNRKITVGIYAVDRSGTPVSLARQSVLTTQEKPVRWELGCSGDKLDFSKYQNKIGFEISGDDGKIIQQGEYVLKSYPPMTLNSSVLLEKKKFYYTVNIAGLPAPMDKTTLECSIQENGKTTKTWKIRNPSGRVQTGIYTPTKWDADISCRLHVRAVDHTSGKVLAEKSIEFSVPKKEIWQDTTAGMDGTVPPPWVPVKRSGKNIQVWNREYRIRNNALPGEIISGGRHLLSSPIELTVTGKDGKSLVFGNLKFSEEKRDDEVKFSASAENADFSAEISGVVEFDGFSWYDLILKPKRSGAELNSLSFDFSIPENEIDFALINYFGGTYADLKGKSEIPETTPFVRQILYGNDERAIAFFMESDEFFFPQHRKNLIRHVVKDNRRHVKIAAVESPVKLDREFHYGIGFQAAPLKPMPKDWRSWIQNYSSRYAKEDKMIQIWTWSKWYGFLRPHTPEAFRKNLSVLTKNHPNAHIQPYFCQYILSTVSPEYKLYGEEWKKYPIADLGEMSKKSPGKCVVACLGAKTYRDFWLYTLQNFLEEYPEVGGCYWDSIDPIVCENPYHGHGWTDSEGKRHPTQAVRQYREFYKRAYRIIKKKHPDAIITGHASERRFLPTISFCDVVYDGEQFVSNVASDPIYTAWLSDTYCRAFFGKQIGLVPLFLPAYYNNEKLIRNITPPTESIYLHSLVYDFLVHSHRVNNNVTDEILSITRKFNISEAEYYPPYSSQISSFLKVESPENSDVRIALYRKKNGRMLIVLGNFGKRETDVRIFIPDAEKLTERRSGTDLPKQSDHSFRTTIQANNFVLLEK